MKTMKTIKKLFAISMIFASVFFVACNDDENNMLSPDDSKVILENLDADMQSDLDQMQNAQGFKAFVELQDMDDPFSIAKSTKGSFVFNTIKKYLTLSSDKGLKSVKEEGHFDFTGNLGTYTWSIASQAWDITHGGTNIVINFPTDSTLTENNATLTINNFEDQEFVDEYDTWYQPTAIDANLYINDTKYVELVLDATWQNNGDPQGLDLSVYLLPFEFTIEFTDGATSTSITEALFLNNNQIMSIGGTIIFTDNTKEELSSVNGYVQYRTIKVKANVDVSALIELVEEMESDNHPYTTNEEIIDAVNKTFYAGVYNESGKKMATIELGIINNETDIVLTFEDGSQELAEPYFENFIDGIKEFIDEMGITLDNNFDFKKK